MPQAEMLVTIIAQTIQQLYNCAASGNTLWQERCEAKLSMIAHELLPSGSGVDNGTRIREGDSYDGWQLKERIVLELSFHHMNEAGAYDGWTDHTIVITPSLTADFALRITGRDRNDIKEYLHQVYHAALSERYVQSWDESPQQFAFWGVRSDGSPAI